jgi:hypothetical protein
MLQLTARCVMIAVGGGGVHAQVLCAFFDNSVVCRCTWIGRIGLLQVNALTNDTLQTESVPVISSTLLCFVFAPNSRLFIYRRQATVRPRFFCRLFRHTAD